MGRAQLSDALAIASGRKAAVAEAYITTGTLTGVTAGAFGVPADVASNAGKYADSLTVADGVIVATMKATGVATCAQSTTITLTPIPGATASDPIKWTCAATAACKPSTCAD
jgi:type IV pilus assembly protein PilA